MRSLVQLIIAAALLALLFFGINLGASALPALRLDATQGRVFTLSDASARIARSPQEPITLTLYYSERLARGRGQIASFGQRVRELLGEYARASNGAIRLEVVDPVPFSEAEDRATSAGVEGVAVGDAGEKFYLGLAGVNAVDGREVIPFFDPERERFLEHDISRMIVALAEPKRRVIALVTSLPIEGGMELDPRTGQPRQTRPYRVVTELATQFDLRSLGQDFEAVPADADALWIVHPTGLSERAQRAIDEYLMGGGRILAMVDPACETDPAAARARSGPGESGTLPSSVLPMLEAWGVRLVPGVIAADREYATRIAMGGPDEPPLSFVAWPTFTGAAFNKDDPATGMLTRVTMASPGVLEASRQAGAEGGGGGGDAVTLEPLITSSADSMRMPTSLLSLQPDPAKLLGAFTRGDAPLVVAARVRGTITSAFAPADTSAPTPVASPDATLVVIADADIASDGLWVQEQRVAGLIPIVRTLADNGDFIVNVLDSITGSSDLIKVRARQSPTRPFTLVERMRRDAEERYLAQQQLLEASLAQAEQRITELTGADGEGLLVPTPEVQAELDRVRDEALATRRELRQVRLSLREDVESLERQLLLINTALAPALVAVGGLGVAGVRASRRREAIRAARAMPREAPPAPSPPTAAPSNAPSRTDHTP